MVEEPQSRPAPLSGHAASEPTGALLWTLALALSAYVIAYPFTLARYPPITDLPLHAAAASMLRHYFDPAYGFRETLSQSPLQTPALAMHATGALFAMLMPIAAATKLMAMTMLALVPAGLAVLCLGMRKSPLWGVMGLFLTWCTSTQAGDLGGVGAAGLSAMSVGLALLVVRRPTRARRLRLALALVAIFFTDASQLPLAIAFVLVSGALTFPATRRFAPLVVPLAPALALLCLWLAVRLHDGSVVRAVSELHFRPERVLQLGTDLFGSYSAEGHAPMTAGATLEHGIAKRTFGVGLFAIAAAIALYFSEGRARGRKLEEIRWAIGVTVLPLALSAGLLAFYLSLPNGPNAALPGQPEVAMLLALCAMGVAPDLPRGILPRVAFILLFAIGSLPMSRFVSARFRELDTALQDFRAIVALAPRAPRLCAVENRGGEPVTRITPLSRLPAWIQAEKGGALKMVASQGFSVRQEGWFDTFLVRAAEEPRALFVPDPSVQLEAHRGAWWLYRRLP